MQGSSVAEDDVSDSEVPCLMRVGKNSDWLRFYENSEITVGRGLDVTYQLLSPSCPLMISRLHCTFRQRDDGQWTVTDKKSLNGVWVNGRRIPAEEAYPLKLGDSIQLGVPVIDTKVEFDYVLVKRPLKDIKAFLTKGQREAPRAQALPKKAKRKLVVEEVEPSTSKPKLYCCSPACKALASACPLSSEKCKQMLGHKEAEEREASTGAQKVDQPSEMLWDTDGLQTYSQNILMLQQQMDSTQKQVASLGTEPEKTDPLREEQVRELQAQLETLRSKMHQMEALERTFSDAQRRLETQKTQQEEEVMKKKLQAALQEQNKVIDELALSRQAYEEILSAKNKELEVTKEEKEKACAQKEEVVTQVTEVLENELQCIICSELFVEAVILSCAHSFCSYCIKQWRKKKDECPICRQAILSQTRCLALDNCISSMVESLSLDMKARRETLIAERKGPEAAGVVVIDDSEDEDSSSSSSSSSSWSSDSGDSLMSTSSSFTSALSRDMDSSVLLDSSPSLSLGTKTTKTNQAKAGKVNPPEYFKKMSRRIFAEDPDWSLDTVPRLSIICLESIAANFQENPVYEDLTAVHKHFVQERLSTSLPLRITANLIGDGVYWKRCCQQRWSFCDVSCYGHSWKRMFFERHVAHVIEFFVPGVTNPATVLDLVPLCNDYVRRLSIAQLLPPIRNPQKEVEGDEEDEEDPSTGLESETAKGEPDLDHFDFGILLDKLTDLQELQLVYQVKNCGMNFEWRLNEMTVGDCEALGRALRACATLKTLRIYQSHINDDKCCKLVRHLLDHPSLRTLDFSYNLIGDKGAKAISQLLLQSRLETLRMSNNSLGEQGARAIAQAVSQNPTLQSLNLRLNRVQDEGGEAIARALLKNTGLCHLHLGANELTGRCAAALAKALLRNSTLKSLNLSCNNLGVDGGKALQEAMSSNSSLTECDVRLTEMEDEAASFIKQVLWSNRSLKQKRNS